MFVTGDRVIYGWADGGPMRRWPLTGRIVGIQEPSQPGGEPMYLVHADSFTPWTPPYQRVAAELEVA